MAQLIKVSVSLSNIDKQIDPPWRTHVQFASSVATFVSFLTIEVMALLVGPMPILLLPLLLFTLSALVAVACQVRYMFLPASARKFLRETRSERLDLVRRTEAHNRAWCLTERSGDLRPSDGDPYLSSFQKLDVEVRAYAERYRSAVATDIAMVSARANRRLLRESLKERVQDLCELEARLAELGQDASPEAHTHVVMMREKLESDTLTLKCPLSLPAAKVVSS